MKISTITECAENAPPYRISVVVSAKNAHKPEQRRGLMLSVQRPSGGVRRALAACQVEGKQLRFRDLTSDHQHLQADGKDIDVFTEHEVDVQLARQHFRVCDDERCWDEQAVRVRVRDVDRRRARVADHENVMNVLTEHVQVSEMLQNSISATFGALSWSADARSVKFNETKQERVEFGDMEKQTDPEPVVTLAEDLEEENGGSMKTENTVVIEELAPEDDDVRMASGDQQDVENVAPKVLRQPKTPRKLARSCNVKYSDDRWKDSIRDAYCSAKHSEDVLTKNKVNSKDHVSDAINNQHADVRPAKPFVERKWSRRNRAGSCGYLDKPVRRRVRKNLSLRRMQSASNVIK